MKLNKRWQRSMKKFFKKLVKALLLLVVLFIAFFFLLFFLTSGEYTVAETVEQDSSIPHITIDGVTFHSETFGDRENPVVIVVHGGPGSDYRSLLSLKNLSDEYYVVFYDQRGTGLSPRVSASELTIDSSISDLGLIVDYYSNGKKVNLIGHSWGAMLVSAYIGQHPDKVDRAVLAEPPFLTTDKALKWLEKMNYLRPNFTNVRYLYVLIRAKFESFHVKGPDSQAKSDYFHAQIENASDDDSQLAYFCNKIRPQATSIQWRLGSVAWESIMRSAMDSKGNIDVDFVKGVDKFTNRVLFITGECNKIIGAKWQREQMEFFPNAKLSVIKKSGHEMFVEQPGETIAIIRSYLKEFPAEDAGDKLDKADLIRVSIPRPNQVISSPFVIEGEARGVWFFEGDFPIKLIDDKGNVLTSAIAQAQGEWMTENFVVFKAELEFSTPKSTRGMLIFEKDNPTGLPKYADQLRIGVKFR